MAERRMFAKTIVTSDAFLDMPWSARGLYFALGMFADDDGFVNNPKSIMRQVGACADDLNLLLLKRFILSFESGVIVIKHWRIHNYIRNDRYKETKYIEEKASLMLDEKGAYTEYNGDIVARETVGIPSDIPMVDKRYPQDRIGEDRLGKDNSFIHSAREDDDDDDEHVENSEDLQLEYLGGTLGGGVVLLSKEQFADLCDRLSIEELNKYIGIVRDCELNGKSYTRKTHYQAILDMVKKDRKVKDNRG
jgi:hypothetical protein